MSDVPFIGDFDGAKSEGRFPEIDHSDLVADSTVFSLDDVFEVLKSRRRRYALYYLANHGTAKVETVAQQVAAWEFGRPVDDVPDEEHRRVFVDMVQSHIPKMADEKVIEHDDRSDAVRFTEPPEVLLKLLRYTGEREGLE